MSPIDDTTNVSDVLPAPAAAAAAGATSDAAAAASPAVMGLLAPMPAQHAALKAPAGAPLSTADRTLSPHFTGAHVQVSAAGAGAAGTGALVKQGACLLGTAADTSTSTPTPSLDPTPTGVTVDTDDDWAFLLDALDTFEGGGPTPHTDSGAGDTGLLAGPGTGPCTGPFQQQQQQQVKVAAGAAHSSGGHSARSEADVAGGLMDAFTLLQPSLQPAAAAAAGAAAAGRQAGSADAAADSSSPASCAGHAPNMVGAKQEAAAAGGNTGPGAPAASATASGDVDSNSAVAAASAVAAWGPAVTSATAPQDPFHTRFSWAEDNSPLLAAATEAAADAALGGISLSGGTTHSPGSAGGAYSSVGGTCSRTAAAGGAGGGATGATGAETRHQEAPARHAGLLPQQQHPAPFPSPGGASSTSMPMSMPMSMNMNMMGMGMSMSMGMPLSMPLAMNMNSHGSSFHQMPLQQQQQQQLQALAPPGFLQGGLAYPPAASMSSNGIPGYAASPLDPQRPQQLQQQQQPPARLAVAPLNLNQFSIPGSPLANSPGAESMRQGGGLFGVEVPLPRFSHPGMGRTIITGAQLQPNSRQWQSACPCCPPGLNLHTGFVTPGLGGAGGPGLGGPAHGGPGGFTSHPGPGHLSIRPMGQADWARSGPGPQHSAGPMDMGRQVMPHMLGQFQHLQPGPQPGPSRPSATAPGPRHPHAGQTHQVQQHQHQQGSSAARSHHHQHARAAAGAGRRSGGGSSAATAAGSAGGKASGGGGAAAGGSMPQALEIHPAALSQFGVPEESFPVMVGPPKRKRGRPRKHPLPEVAAAATAIAAAAAAVSAAPAAATKAPAAVGPAAAAGGVCGGAAGYGHPMGVASPQLQPQQLPQQPLYHQQQQQHQQLLLQRQHLLPLQHQQHQQQAPVPHLWAAAAAQAVPALPAAAPAAAAGAAAAAMAGAWVDSTLPDSPFSTQDLPFKRQKSSDFGWLGGN